jgi:hypothetical protein
MEHQHPVFMLLDVCPECKEKRAVLLNKKELIREIDAGEPVGLLAACGHTWYLSPNDCKEFRRALADVLFA